MKRLFKHIFQEISDYLALGFVLMSVVVLIIGLMLA
jgi:hypothetical protein